MKHRTRRAALRATAKVALALTVMGCGTTITVAPSEETPDPEEDIEPIPTAELDREASGLDLPTTEPELVCQAPLDGEVTPDPEQLTCCTDFLMPELPEAPEQNEAWADFVASDDAQACCHVVVHNVAFPPFDEQAMHLVGRCCEARGFPSTPACSPWGPPVPPAVVDGLPSLGEPTIIADDDVIDLRAQARGHMPAIDGEVALFGAARLTWKGRMVNEYLSATVFEGLAEQIHTAELNPALAARCHEFAAEERKHGVLCGAVVEALGGEALAPRPPREAYPVHAEATPLEGLLRNVLSICCMAETVAVALVGAERLEMPEGELRKLLTRIYADEVGHARFGWQLVARLAPRLTAAERGRLNRYLVLALAHLEEHELAHIPPGTQPASGAALGLCSGDDARVLLYETIEEVIVPGLEQAGFDARRAWDVARTRSAA